MSDENKKTIKLVISTLGSVSVAGKNNLDMLLGCILALERLIEEPKASEQKED